MVFGGEAEDLPDRDTMDEAREACEPLMEGLIMGPDSMSPEEQAEMQDEMLEFTECMREHGVDLPDPEFDGDGGRMTQEMPDIDPESDTFQDAQEACANENGGVGPAFRAGPGDDGPRTDDRSEGDDGEADREDTDDE
jgi:hypothetical protein